MKRIILVLMVGMLLLSGIPANAQVESLDISAIDELISALLAEYGVPGIAVAVVHEGEVAFAQGYGVRSVETNEPVAEDTQFSIGSITKSFTALAIAQQVDAGTLDLDAPITDYLPDFQLSDPAMTEKLTLRALLSNTAGFAPDDIAWYSGSLQTMAEVAEYVQTLPVTSEPGTTYAYNNLGYALAGYVLEQVTGQSWHDYVRENILLPLEMDSATTSFAAMQQTDNHVEPHIFDIREGSAKQIPFFTNDAPIAPAGAINASVLEMANYVLLQLSDGSFNGDPIVSEALLDEMHSEQVPGYGLGWVPAEYEGYEIVWHNGSIDGLGALLMTVPSENLGVVMMMNGDFSDYVGFADALTLRVIEIALGLTPTVDIVETLQMQTGLDPIERDTRVAAAQNYPVDIASYEALIGDYNSPVGEIMIYLEGETLFASITQQGFTQAAELIEFEPNQFMLNARQFTSVVLEFLVSEDGTVTLLQEGQQIGQKLGEGVELSTYTDPQNRFSVVLPQGWTAEAEAEAEAEIAVLTAQDIAGSMALGATDASDNLQADAAAFAQELGVTVSGDPLAINPIPLPNGQAWTQYVWVVSGDTFIAVNSFARDGIAYFISLQATQTEGPMLLNPMNDLLLNFDITE